MSVQTLYTAATGMEALQTKLDVIANNLANVNTTGFKKGRTNFEDLFYRHHVEPGATDAGGNTTATGTSVGLGAKVSSIQTNFTQGAAKLTNRPLDLYIEGNGFFQVEDPSGETFYTRAGDFSLNAEGDMVVGSASTGRRLSPNIQIPEDAVGVVVTAEGIVQYRQAGNETLQQAGTIQLVQFRNPEGLLKRGENMYEQTEASGNATPANPGQQGLGLLRQNMLEASNVEPVQELIDLIKTQRAFELNSQTVQASDQIIQLVANLRRI